MKLTGSLKQVWTTLIVLSVVVPITIVTTLYGYHHYASELKMALMIKRQANESLRDHIESKIDHIKVLLHSKGDSILLLLDKEDNLNDLNTFLENVIERDPAVREVMILSKQGVVIAAIDPMIGVIGDNAPEQPEIIIPSMGRDYIGSPRRYDDFIAFSISTPIGDPVKAILLAVIDVAPLLHEGEHGVGTTITRDYLLDRRGALLTEIDGSKYKPGDLMTHLAMTRAALINEEWPVEVPYIGVINKSVFGTVTTIPTLNWSLVSEVISDEILAPIRKESLRIIVFALSIAFFFVLFALFLTYKTLRPIQQIGEAINRVTRGDFQTQLKPSKIRELGAIAIGFNRMSEARRDAENLLREREQDLAVTLNSIADAVIVTNAAGHVTRMNPIAELFTGWLIEEAHGKLLQAVFPIMDSVTCKSIGNPVEKVLAIGETVYFDNHPTLTAKDGTKYQIASSAAPIRSEDGNIQGVVLVFNDVTEQYQLRQITVKHNKAVQESERRLAEAQRMAHIGNWELNPVNNKLQWSKEVYRIFEIDFREFGASFKAFMNVIHPEDRERVNTVYTESLRNKTAYSIEYRLRMLDGRIKHVHVRCKTFYDGGGNPIRSTGTVQDITEKVEIEDQLRRNQKMNALGKLTSGVAHDYNNMLGVIIGYSELLGGALSEQPKLAKYAHEIHRAGKRGAKLTKKLLAFSREKSADAEMCNLNALLQGEQHMLGKTLTVRIQLVLDLADDLWPVWLDSGDLEDAIVNLSINAMHAIDGNGLLTLQTSNVLLNAMDAKQLNLEPGDYVLFGITDNGCGMDETTKERIFEPFYSTKGEQGIGLGMSQVYGFVERSNGAIKVDSEPGHGTHFALYFPRYYESDRDEQSAEEGHPANYNKGNETILVVDDESTLLNLTREILGQHGYKVICAQSGEQALDILATESIDLLISDVIMPEMDGYQLANAVQEKYPAVKIQLASGYADGHHKELVEDTLHQNLLNKPFSSKTLLQKIRALLSDQQNEPELSGDVVRRI